MIPFLLFRITDPGAAIPSNIIVATIDASDIERALTIDEPDRTIAIDDVARSVEFIG